MLFCCETYKFCERMQLDCIVSNELGDPQQIVDISAGQGTEGEGAGKAILTNWATIPKLRLLNLVCDLTPIEFVTMVVSDVGMIPPTSVPVIIREQQVCPTSTPMSSMCLPRCYPDARDG